MPLDYNIAFKAGDGVPAVATRTSLLKDSLGLDIETAKLDAITREAAQDAGIQAIFKNAKDPEEALKQVQMSYPHEWGAMRKDLDAHYENVWTEQVKKDNHAIATTKFIGESARAVTDEASFNVFEYVTRDLRQKMGIPLSPWDAGGRETVATLSHYGETSTDRLNAQRERHQSYLTDQLKEAGVLGEFASAENQVDWNQAHAHAGELGFGTHFTESMGMVYDANSVVRARRQWDLARQKTSTQSDVKIGSLEDFLTRKYGANPTYEQMLEGRREYNASSGTGTSVEERQMEADLGPNPTEAERNAWYGRRAAARRAQTGADGEKPLTAAQKAQFTTARATQLRAAEIRFRKMATDEGWIEGGKLGSAVPPAILQQWDDEKLRIENLWRDNMGLPQVASLEEARYRSAGSTAPASAQTAPPSAPATTPTTGGTKTITKAKLKLLAIRTGTSYEVEAARAKANNYSIIEQ